MKVISFISQKGGVGKTTLCIHLAVAFAEAGYNVVVVDLDPQVSAAEWKDFRQEDMPGVVAIPSSRLAKVLQELRKGGAEIVILDTAPHSEGTALDAARAADLILVPCQPSIMDLRAMRKTSNILRNMEAPVFAVLNAVPPQASVADNCAEAIKTEFNMAVCPVRLGSRVAYNRCLVTGLTAQEFEPGSKAALEVQELYMWVCKQADLSVTQVAA